MGRRWNEGAGQGDGRQPSRSIAGQSTLEYALVLMAFLAMLLGMGAIWHASREGKLVEQARDAASHSCPEGVNVKVLQDVTAF